MCGTDVTIGADTALHRIVEAVDAIQSTASSHRRSFVVEVMGRHCGYLALMGGLATGANFVIIPERPPDAGWEDAMCRVLSSGRRVGRRANIVLIAEHSHDVAGNPITADGVKDVLQDRLGEDARVTILGHVQRGGAPSAYDRYLGTVLGRAATRRVLEHPGGEPQLFGVRGKRIVHSPLMERVAETRSIASLIEDGRYDAAMVARGSGFSAAQLLLHTLTRAAPSVAPGGADARTIAVLHAGSPAPGMNAAIRTAVRVAADAGHRVLAVRDGFRGLLDGDVEEFGWMSVSGWAWEPGALLGTSSRVLDTLAAEAAGAVLAEHDVDGLLVIGGRQGYASAAALHRVTGTPVACVPASIHNNLPGCDHSIGADSALNSIMTAVDKIKQSAVAAHRCSVVEVMGRQSGYLALLSALATGAEQVYLPHHQVTLDSLTDDLHRLRAGFAAGKRRWVVIRSEQPGSAYTTDFMAGMFAQESDGLFEVDRAILGHVQQGGAPSPFDRVQAARLAAAGVEVLIDEMGDSGDGMMVGSVDGEICRTPLRELELLLDLDAGLPRVPRWWHDLYPLVELLAEPS
jgi:6-phosphofructokinase 1